MAHKDLPVCGTLVPVPRCQHRDFAVLTRLRTIIPNIWRAAIVQLGVVDDNGEGPGQSAARDVGVWLKSR